MGSPVAGSGIGSTWTSFPSGSRNWPPMKFGTVSTLIAGSWSRDLEPAARDERAAAFLAAPLPFLDQDVPALHDHLRQTPYFQTLIARVVHVHVMGLGRDGPPGFRVEHHDVGVEPGGDGTLPWIQAEHPGRSGGDQIDPPAGT